MQALGTYPINQLTVVRHGNRLRMGSLMILTSSPSILIREIQIILSRRHVVVFMKRRMLATSGERSRVFLRNHEGPDRSFSILQSRDLCLQEQLKAFGDPNVVATP